MDQITISNITQRDCDKKQIRILAQQKPLFPPEQQGLPQTYEITIKWEDTLYRCIYRIGSKDGKARSGVLRLSNELAVALGNRTGENLLLKQTGNNKYDLTVTAL